MTSFDPPPPHLGQPPELTADGLMAATSGPRLAWGAGGMRPDGLAVVCNDVVVRARRRIVELGSGVSTVLLARLLTRRQPRGGWRLAAIEHDAGWVQRVADQLQLEGVGDQVEVVHAPLVPHSLAEGNLLWYDEAAVAAGLDTRLGGDLIDLLVVDGPPAYAPGYGLARYPALPLLRHRLAPGATVVLDDVDRPGEQEVVRRWERECGLSFQRLSDDAGVAVATVSGTARPSRRMPT